MSLFFFDTSALVKRYHLEAGSEEVDRIFAETDAAFAISNITIAEFTSALTRKQNNGAISEDDFAHAFSEFSKDIISEFWIIDLERSHINHSVALIMKHNIRTLDSLQLAILISIRNSNPTLVASDKALEQAASAEGINVINPEGR